MSVPATHFVTQLQANIDNDKLTDKAFREFVRNTLPIVEGYEDETKKDKHVSPKVSYGQKSDYHNRW